MIVLEGNVRRGALRSLRVILVDASFDELSSLSQISPNTFYHRNTQLFQRNARVSELMFASLVVAMGDISATSNTIVLQAGLYANMGGLRHSHIGAPSFSSKRPR
jgi:hypothetical protein